MVLLTSLNAFPPCGLKIVKDLEILLGSSEQTRRQMDLKSNSWQEHIVSSLI